MSTPKCSLFCTLIMLFIISFQSKSVVCSIYQVGDLDAWGIPSSSNPNVYTKWAKKFDGLKIGDSLFFLYPPSQDSVIQVTKDSFDNCNLKDPILYMNNGNSLFNITAGGNFYFTSAEDGHCGKSQKLHVFVSGNGSYVDDSGSAAPTPSYNPAFGSIPVQAASGSLSLRIPVLLGGAAAVLVAALVI